MNKLNRVEVELDVEDVMENGEIVLEEVSEEENDDSGVIVYSYKDKFVVLSFDIGGSLGGEEVYNSMDEIEMSLLVGE